jgi:uncharacterized protein YchJ
MNLDGSGQTLILEEDIFYINVIGDWIYFTNESDGSKIYKVRTDGTEKTKVGNDSASFVTVVGDWIYYSANGFGYKIYKIRASGGVDANRTQLNADNSRYVAVSGDWIYYRNESDAEKCYRVKTDGTGRQKLNEEPASFINVVGDWVYYVTSGHLRRMHPDGTGWMNIVDASGMFMNVDANCIIFSLQSEGGVLCNQNLDGSGMSIGPIGTDSAQRVNRIGDWIYYWNVSDSNRLYRIKTDGSGRVGV